MNRLYRLFKKNSGKVFFVVVVLFVILLVTMLSNTPVEGLDNKLVYLIKKYGYGILFIWSILEGEIGLVMAGLLCHSGDMNLFLAIFIAGLGGFVGDQIYFYIGRYNKDYMKRSFKKHSRKVAFVNLLLRKYGIWIIFVQRYMYGMRTIIPMSIGLSRYDAKKFAFVNLISAWTWAAFTIVPVWYFGQEIIDLFHLALEHWYYIVPLVLIVGILMLLRVRKHVKDL